MRFPLFHSCMIGFRRAQCQHDRLVIVSRRHLDGQCMHVLLFLFYCVKCDDCDVVYMGDAWVVSW